MTAFAAVDWDIDGALLGSIRSVLDITVGGAHPPPLPLFKTRFAQLASFNVSQTGFSPAMIYLLWDIGWRLAPRRLLGCGTFEGLAFCALAAGACDRGALCEATAVEGGAAPVLAARQNSRTLSPLVPVNWIEAVPARFAASVVPPLDALFIDVLDPVREKADYGSIVEGVMGKLARGGVILAHDACVPRWDDAIRGVEALLASTPAAMGRWEHWRLPVDEAGILVAILR